MEAKEEIRSRLNIEDVIGEYVQLKRAGRNFKGLSPFTSERTPSFIVSPDKQIWHDFSSNRGGDIFSFVMEVEGLDFRGAVEMLARKAGVDLTQYQSSRDGSFAKKRQRLLSALDLAATYYQQSLVSNQRAIDYVFRERSLSKEIVQEFRIGYSPQADDALIGALTKRGFTIAELKDAGLAVQRRGRWGDMFRGRMMVPLSDGQGQVVGFTARIIGVVEGAPKYINTPQTLLYDKGRQLFGLSQAKETIRREDKGVIVEGNLDVVSSHQAGIKNVVAAAGTAMTEYHLKSLSRLTHHVALAFDGDKAGIAATERAIDIAQSVGVRLTIVTLPGDAKDPDELIQQDPALWSKAITESSPVVDWIIDRYKVMYDVRTAEGKRELTTRALAVINTLQDAVEREHYVELLAQVTVASIAALQEKSANLDEAADDIPRLKKVKHEPQRPAEHTVVKGYQDSLLSLALCDNGVRDAMRSLTAGDFSLDEQRAVFEFLQSDPSHVISEEVPAELQFAETYVKILLLQAETRYGNWNGHDRYFEATELVKRLKKENDKKRKDTLSAELREAQAAGDTAKARILMQQINELLKGEKHAK